MIGKRNTDCIYRLNIIIIYTLTPLLDFYPRKGKSKNYGNCKKRFNFIYFCIRHENSVIALDSRSLGLRQLSFDRRCCEVEVQQ